MNKRLLCLLVLPLVILVACASPVLTTAELTNEPAPPTSPADTQTPARTPTASLIPPTHAASLTVQPSGTHIEPLAAGEGGLLHESWSPDSRWLLYFDLEGKTGYVTNAGSGEVCPFAEIPQADEYWCYFCEPGGPILFTWQADGRILLIDQGKPTIVTPCGESTSLASSFPSTVTNIESISKDQRLFVLRDESGHIIYDSETQRTQPVPIADQKYPPGISWSPGGTLLGVSIRPPDGEADMLAVTTLISVQTGQVVEEIHWHDITGHRGCCDPPDWISETQYILNDIERGPLLVTVGQGEVSLMPDPFDVPPCIEASCIQPSVYVLTDSAGRYHLLMDKNQGDARYLLYHPETDEVESLPDAFRYLFHSTKDYFGVSSQSASEVYFRPLDPPGAALEPQIVPPDMQRSTSSPAGTLRAVVKTDGSIGIYTPQGELLGSWWAEGVEFWRISWSPDEEHVALVGDGPPSSRLFVVSVP